MKVLLLLEDPTLDQYVVKPIIEKIFDDLSRTATVFVLKDPTFRGIGDALDRGKLTAVIEENPMIDIFLLIVDRDCDREGNSARVAARERDLGAMVVGCLAREEVECWMLAAQSRLPASWSEIRSECDPKEAYAEPWLRSQGWATDLAGGRKRAMAAGGWYRRLLNRCSEIRELRDRLEDHAAVARP